MTEGEAIALMRQRLERVEADVARNTGRLDLLGRVEERLSTVQDDVRDLTATMKGILAGEADRRAHEVEQLQQRRETERAERKQDRRTMWGIGGSLFVGIVIFVLGLAQAGILGGH